MEQGITKMSKNNIIHLSKNQDKQEKVDVSLSYYIGKIRKISDNHDIPNQIVEISLLLKDLDFGENPYQHIIESYKNSVLFKYQFNLMLRKLPTMVVIELIDILGDMWPKGNCIIKRLKLMIIKSLESGLSIPQLQKMFLKNQDICDYLLQGSQSFEDFVLGNNVVSILAKEEKS